jgi:hypothetical protein
MSLHLFHRKFRRNSLLQWQIARKNVSCEQATSLPSETTQANVCRDPFRRARWRTAGPGLGSQ